MVEKIRNNLNLNPDIKQNVRDPSFPISDSIKGPSLFWMVEMVFIEIQPFMRVSLAGFLVPELNL